MHQGFACLQIPALTLQLPAEEDTAEPSASASGHAASLEQTSGQGRTPATGLAGEDLADTAESPGAIPFGRSDSQHSIAHGSRDALTANEGEDGSLAFFANGTTFTIAASQDVGKFSYF